MCMIQPDLIRKSMNHAKMTLYRIMKLVAHSCHVILCLYITNIDVRKDYFLATGMNEDNPKPRLSNEISVVIAVSLNRPQHPLSPYKPFVKENVCGKTIALLVFSCIHSTLEFILCSIFFTWPITHMRQFIRTLNSKRNCGIQQGTTTRMRYG